MNNPLDEFKKAFSGLLKKKDKSVVGIDIGASAIKMVQIREEGGKAILETYGSLSLGPYKDPKGVQGEIANLPAEALSSAIRDLIREANVTTKRSVCAIPSAATLVFTLTLPASVRESEFASVIPIEARRYIPIDINEVTLDWWTLPNRTFVTPEDPVKKEEPKETTVLVVAVRKDTVTSFDEVMTLSGLQKDFFEVEAFSSVRGYAQRELGTMVLIDIGAARTKLIFVDGGVIRDVHVINRGSEDITQGLVASFNLSFENAEDIKKVYGLFVEDDTQQKNMYASLDFIISEMKNVIYQYEQKQGKGIEKMILSGGGSRMKGLFDYFGDKFSVEISFADPFVKTEAPEFLREALRDAGPEFTIAIGLCLRSLRS